MYKSFKFVVFNNSFPNPAKFQIQPKFWPELDISRILAGAGAELRYSPSSSSSSSSRAAAAGVWNRAKEMEISATICLLWIRKDFKICIL